MLLTGLYILVVFSPTAKPSLTTVSSLLVMKITTGSSRTLGVPLGVNKVTSDLLTVTLAVSLTLLLSLVFEFN